MQSLKTFSLIYSKKYINISGKENPFITTWAFKWVNYSFKYNFYAL